jgi:hypothetical protein
MSDPIAGSIRLDLGRHELEVEDRLEEPELNEQLWLPASLPHRGSREAAAARFRVEWFRGHRPVRGPGARSPALPGWVAVVPGTSDARG